MPQGCWVSAAWRWRRRVVEGGLKARFLPLSPPESLSPHNTVFTCLENCKTILDSQFSGLRHVFCTWRSAEEGLALEVVVLERALPPAKSQELGVQGSGGKEGWGRGSPGKQNWEPEPGSSICERTWIVKMGSSLLLGWGDDKVLWDRSRYEVSVYCSLFSL